ncbi:uncharacterized protein [Amphiura filiformis]|uniref:uncharacterized protein n=1 Tax=Amphiura filiformis TaxID=82378 RepID=UPI003B210B69
MSYLKNRQNRFTKHLCPICPATFAVFKNLKKHMKTHAATDLIYQIPKDSRNFFNGFLEDRLGAVNSTDQNYCSNAVSHTEHGETEITNQSHGSTPPEQDITFANNMTLISGEELLDSSDIVITQELQVPPTSSSSEHVVPALDDPVEKSGMIFVGLSCDSVEEEDNSDTNEKSMRKRTDVECNKIMSAQKCQSDSDEGEIVLLDDDSTDEEMLSNNETCQKHLTDLTQALIQESESISAFSENASANSLQTSVNTSQSLSQNSRISGNSSDRHQNPGQKTTFETPSYTIKTSSQDSVSLQQHQHTKRTIGDSVSLLAQSNNTLEDTNAKFKSNCDQTVHSNAAVSDSDDDVILLDDDMDVDELSNNAARACDDSASSIASMIDQRHSGNSTDMSRMQSQQRSMVPTSDYCQIVSPEAPGMLPDSGQTLKHKIVGTALDMSQTSQWSKEQPNKLLLTDAIHTSVNKHNHSSNNTSETSRWCHSSSSATADFGQKNRMQFSCFLPHFRCKYCCQSFHIFDAYSKHLYAHRRKLFRQRNIKRKHLYSRPFANTSKGTAKIESIVRICPMCGKGFVGAAWILHYVNRCLHRRQCQYCDKSFDTSDEMRDHEGLHLSVTPYQCSTCGRGFAVEKYYKMHLIMHQNDRHSQ